MLNFFSKLNDKNKVTMADGNDIYIDMLKIGRLINELGTNKEKDLTQWSHKKDGTYKLNKTEIAIINSIDDETLEKAVSNFIKKYNYVDFMKDYTKYDFNTNTLMKDNKMYYIKDTERLKILGLA